jgi:holo-[acyl-carrier protein] synthase
MIIGVGVDVCEVARLKAALERHPGLRDKVFTPGELGYTCGLERDAESLAGRWAAKEALVKALGGGFEPGEAEVVALPDGKPGFALSGAAAKKAAELLVGRTHLSISHDGGVAVALVVVEGKD